MALATTIESKLLKKVVEILGLSKEEAEALSYDTPIFSISNENGVDIGLDSISILELTVELYETWGVDVPIEDMQSFDTIQEIAQYIREHSSNL